MLEQQIFHTDLHIPFLSMINGLILLLGLFAFGKIILVNFKLEKVLDQYSEKIIKIYLSQYISY